MKTKLVQFAAIIDKVETMADRSLKLKIATNELDEKDKAILFGFHQIQIWVALKPTAIVESDIEVGDEKVDKWEKTPAQRLRNTLYILWGQTKPTQGFEEYYRSQMEKFINRIKEKLE